MAIFDNDGTSNFEIGKVYNNDGTAKNQIAKIYDNDGTTNSLIYSSWDGELFLNGEEFREQTGGWTYYHNFYGFSYMENTGSVLYGYTEGSREGDAGWKGVGYFGPSKTIDLTNYSALNLDLDWWKAPSTGTRYLAVLINDQVIWELWDSSGTFRPSFNVSGYSGFCKIQIRLQNFWLGANYRHGFNLRSMILT